MSRLRWHYYIDHLLKWKLGTARYEEKGAFRIFERILFKKSPLRNIMKRQEESFLLLSRSIYNTLY